MMNISDYNNFESFNAIIIINKCRVRDVGPSFSQTKYPFALQDFGLRNPFLLVCAQCMYTEVEKLRVKVNVTIST